MLDDSNQKFRKDFFFLLQSFRSILYNATANLQLQKSNETQLV